MFAKAIKRSGLLVPWMIGIFFLSGLTTNLLEILLFLVVRPFARQLYRLLLSKVLYATYCVATFLCGWWAQVTVLVYCSSEDFEKLGKESAILISNHRGVLDWLSVWLLADETGILGGCKCFVKDKIKFYPTLGWSWWFAEFGFLKRNWQTDKKHVLDTLKGLQDYPCPVWFGIYPEGTRFTPEKLKASQEYAAANGLVPPRHHLIPRPRGFVTTVEALRDSFPALYDFTVMVENEERGDLISMLRGVENTVRLHIRRYDLKSVPHGSYDETAQWCRDRLQDKDDLIEYYFKNHKFPLKSFKVRPTGQCLAVILFWTVLLALILGPSMFKIINSGSTRVFISTAVACVLGLLLTIKMLNLANVQKGSSYGLANSTKNESSDKSDLSEAKKKTS